MLAAGTPAALADPQSDIAQVQAQVRDLQMQAGAAHEEAAKAAEDLAAVQRRLDALTRRADRQRDDLRARQDGLAGLARGLYASGGMDPALQVLFAEDPAQFLAQSAMLGQVAAAQSAQIRQAQTSRLRLAQDEAAITEQQQQAKALQQQMAQAEQQVTARLDEAQAVLATLRQEERDRLARLEAERQRQQQEQARLAAAGTGTVSSTAGGGSPDSGATQGGDVGGSRAQAAVRYALAQVGEPYSYSAQPPNSWDCSKLTAAAWAQSGVSLTALSYTQWDQTRRVPVSQIQPGDLVFYFGQGAHHVAMYIGGGKMVSASNPSDGVEVTDFLGPWYRERFSGVGRVVG